MAYAYPLPQDQWEEAIAKAEEISPHLQHPGYQRLKDRKGKNLIEPLQSIRKSQLNPAKGHFVVYSINKKAYQKMVRFEIKTGSDIRNEDIEDDWKKIHALYIAYLVDYNANDPDRKIYSYTCKGLIAFVKSRFKGTKKKSIIICGKPSKKTFEMMKIRGFTKIAKEEFTAGTNQPEIDYLFGYNYRIRK